SKLAASPKRLYILRTDSLETMSRLVSNQPQG
ncbi:hypothetical protein, partial [Escherichia coli]